MEAHKVLAFLERLCRDLDEGRPLSRFGLGKVLAPVAVPAALALTLGVASCDSDDPPVEEDPVVETCDDGLDNDDDGLIDCDDSDCAASLACYAVPFEECGNGIDDDGDGDADCADSECFETEPCGPENTFETCSDAIDNDGDGAVDCDDRDCATADVCYATPFL